MPPFVSWDVLFGVVALEDRSWDLLSGGYSWKAGAYDIEWEWGEGRFRELAGSLTIPLSSCFWALLQMYPPYLPFPPPYGPQGPYRYPTPDGPR